MVGQNCRSALKLGRRSNAALPRFPSGFDAAEVDSLAPARSVLAGLHLRSNSFRRWASSLPLSRPHGLCRWQILFAISQMAQIPNGSSFTHFGCQAPVHGPVHRSLGACCPNPFPLRMWGRHSCLPVLGTFQSPDSASNRQLWSAKLENFATGRLESLPYKFEQHAPWRRRKHYAKVDSGFR
jgi:hypothetical protein